MFMQLTHPLCDRHRICARHDAVSEISESMGSRHSINNLQDGGDVFCAALARSDLSTILSSVLEMLGKSLDIQRGITRIFHCKATSKEVKYALFFFVLVDREPNLFTISCIILAALQSGHLAFMQFADLPNCLLFHCSLLVLSSLSSQLESRCRSLFLMILTLSPLSINLCTPLC